MRSSIKVFREDIKEVYNGMTSDKQHEELDKCERIMLDRFDAWREGKKLLSITPKRVASTDLYGGHYVMLTVLYEEE